MSARKVCLLSLKQLAARSLPAGSPLREVLLAERDQVEPQEFIAKLSVWLELLRQVKR